MVIDDYHDENDDKDDDLNCDNDENSPALTPP